MEIKSLKIVALTVEEAFDQIFIADNEQWFKKNHPKQSQKIAEAKYRYSKGTLTYEGKKQLLIALGFEQTQPELVRLTNKLQDKVVS
jgi:hypothetical protein